MPYRFAAIFVECHPQQRPAAACSGAAAVRQRHRNGSMGSMGSMGSIVGSMDNSAGLASFTGKLVRGRYQKPVSKASVKINGSPVASSYGSYGSYGDWGLTANTVTTMPYLKSKG